MPEVCPTPRRRLLAFIGWGIASAAGCASAPAPRRADKPDAAARGVAASAADVARAIVGGRTGGLFELPEFRFHPTSADAIGGLCHWAAAMKKLKIDPLMEVKRVFVAATHAQDSTGIALVEPELSDQLVAEALKRAGGLVGTRTPYPLVDVALPGTEPHVIALIQPRMIVVAPQRYKSRLDRLRVRAKLPPPDGRIAARFFAFDPSACLGNNPKWPDTLVAAHAEIEFTQRGGAIVRFFADSTSDEQAARDAKSLTAEAHRLLTVDLALFELQLLTPPVFESSGRRVFMESGLLPTDVDWILRFNG